MFITITLFVKFLGSRRGHFGNGHLPGYSGRFPEVPTADHGESRGSHQTGGETGQGGVSGGVGNRWVLGGGGFQEFYNEIPHPMFARIYKSLHTCI